MGENRSLQSSHGFRADIYLLWTASTACLIAGLWLPVITFTELIFKKSTFSILGGIADLWQHGEYVLGAVIFIFSVVFPAAKLLSLLVLWFIPFNRTERGVMVHRLGTLGKWSMLDVYVVAMTIVIAKGSTLFKAEPEPGIYYFGASVVLSIFTSAVIERVSKKGPAARAEGG
jgi:paraquat-inducible protein A